MTTDLSQELLTHMALMRRCNSQADAVAWMTKAYNLMDACARELSRPQVFQVPGSYGESFYTLMRASAVAAVDPPRIITPHQAWFDGKTVEYGDRFQNKAWTHKDTMRLERENARKAAENFAGRKNNRHYGAGR